MRKKRRVSQRLLLLVFFIHFAGIQFVMADEGMWLPLYIKQYNEAKMKQLGSNLTTEELYNTDKPSIKDAIVSLGRGNCTGEIVSESGLVFTNHHCVFDFIAGQSDPSNNILKSGFLARNKNIELPINGLTASILVKMENVTEIMNRRTQGVSSPEIRKIRIEIVTDSLQKDAVKGTHYEAEVKPFFGGNQFYLMVYEVFSDVRLVYAPPQGIGKYGGETDNWMWPRHTGDFAILRIYSGLNNKPNSYNKKNIPYQPKHFLTLSNKGVKENDFSFIMGYPGTTKRYLTTNDIEFAARNINPFIIKSIDLELSFMKVEMEKDKNMNIKMASHYASRGNTFKYLLGQQRQLQNEGVKNKIWENEDKLKSFLYTANNKEKYGKIISKIDNANQQLVESEKIASMMLYGVFESRISEYWLKLIPINGLSYPKNRGFNEYFDSSLASILKSTKNYLNDSTQKIDKEILIRQLQYLYKQMPSSIKIDFMEQVLARKFMTPDADTDIRNSIEEVFEHTQLFNKKIIKWVDKGRVKKINKDKLFLFMAKLYNFYQNMESMSESAKSVLDESHRLYIQALLEMRQPKPVYPDANSTLRLTYGQVKSYKPRNGMYYKYYSTHYGVLEKYYQELKDFEAPDRLIKLFKEKQFKNYSYNDTLRINFVANTDITGGNSGSPVMDKNGKLIGIAFDGNWESMIGDLFVDPNLNRTIIVDIRYVLWVLDVYSDAQELIKELKIEN